MTKDEYIRRAREMGYADEDIQDTIESVEQLRGEKTDEYNWEIFLVELPIND